MDCQECVCSIIPFIFRKLKNISGFLNRGWSLEDKLETCWSLCCFIQVFFLSFLLSAASLFHHFPGLLEAVWGHESRRRLQVSVSNLFHSPQEGILRCKSLPSYFCFGALLPFIVPSASGWPLVLRGARSPPSLGRWHTTGFSRRSSNTKGLLIKRETVSDRWRFSAAVCNGRCWRWIDEASVSPHWKLIMLSIRMLFFLLRKLCPFVFTNSRKVFHSSFWFLHHEEAASVTARAPLHALSVEYGSMLQMKDCWVKGGCKAFKEIQGILIKIIFPLNILCVLDMVNQFWS